MEKVIEYLKSKLSINDTIVVACSGGPDSMCLLDLLVSLKDEYNLTIICAHVNHKHRIESDEEEIKVKEYCELNGVIFELYIILDYTDDKFTETEARDKRYNFFLDLKEKYNAKYLMTAHHGDDLIETILMRITRGSNLKGYMGFRLETDKYLRPLIFVPKSEILDYMHKKNLWYAIDVTNDSMVHTRNRYRKNVLPFLKNEEKNIHTKFLKFSDELAEYEEFVNEYLDSIEDSIIDNNVIKINNLLKEKDFIIRKLIERVITRLQSEYKFDINNKNILDIVKMIKSNKSNNQINLVDDFVAIKSYDKLIIQKNIDLENYEIELVDEIKINNIGTIKYVKSTNDSSNNTIRINSKEVKLPLIVRNKMNGDKIAVKNLNGHKKVKDIFIDEKVSVEKRNNYPIVTDSENNIIWIPGIKKSKFDKNIDEFYDIIIKYEEETNE